MAVKIQVKVFCVLCSVVVGYQSFRDSCSLHVQGAVICVAKKGRYIGLESNWVADVASQWEMGREWSSRQCY